MLDTEGIVQTNMPPRDEATGKKAEFYPGHNGLGRFLVDYLVNREGLPPADRIASLAYGGEGEKVPPRIADIYPDLQSLGEKYCWPPLAPFEMLAGALYLKNRLFDMPFAHPPYDQIFELLGLVVKDPLEQAVFPVFDPYAFDALLALRMLLVEGPDGEILGPDEVPLKSPNEEFVHSGIPGLDVAGFLSSFMKNERRWFASEYFRSLKELPPNRRFFELYSALNISILFLTFTFHEALREAVSRDMLPQFILLPYSEEANRVHLNLSRRALDVIKEGSLPITLPKGVTVEELIVFLSRWDKKDIYLKDVPFYSPPTPDEMMGLDRYPKIAEEARKIIQEMSQFIELPFPSVHVVPVLYGTAGSYGNRMLGMFIMELFGDMGKRNYLSKVTEKIRGLLRFGNDLGNEGGAIREFIDRSVSPYAFNLTDNLQPQIIINFHPRFSDQQVLGTFLEEFLHASVFNPLCTALVIPHAVEEEVVSLILEHFGLQSSGTEFNELPLPKEVIYSCFLKHIDPNEGKIRVVDMLVELHDKIYGPDEYKLVGPTLTTNLLTRELPIISPEALHAYHFDLIEIPRPYVPISYPRYKMYRGADQLAALQEIEVVNSENAISGLIKIARDNSLTRHEGSYGDSLNLAAILTLEPRVTKAMTALFPEMFPYFGMEYIPTIYHMKDEVKVLQLGWLETWMKFMYGRNAAVSLVGPKSMVNYALPRFGALSKAQKYVQRYSGFVDGVDNQVLDPKVLLTEIEPVDLVLADLTGFGRLMSSDGLFVQASQVLQQDGVLVARFQTGKSDNVLEIPQLSKGSVTDWFFKEFGTSSDHDLARDEATKMRIGDWHEIFDRAKKFFDRNISPEILSFANLINQANMYGFKPIFAIRIPLGIAADKRALVNLRFNQLEELQSLRDDDPNQEGIFAIVFKKI